MIPSSKFRYLIQITSCFVLIGFTLNFPTYLSGDDRYKEIILSQNPVIYFQLDEGEQFNGAQNLGSIGSGGFFGTSLSEFEQAPLAPGSPGNSIGFNKNADSYVLMPAAEFGFNPSEISVSFWVQGEDNGFSSFFSYAESSAIVNAFGFRSVSGVFRSVIHGQPIDHPDIDVLDGSAHHVGISWHGPSQILKIYVDGQLASTVMQGLFGNLLADGPFVIGQDIDDYDFPYGFQGSQALDANVDEFAVFTRVLSEAEFALQANASQKSIRLDVDSFDAPAGETQDGFIRMTDPSINGGTVNGISSVSASVGGVVVTATPSVGSTANFRDRGGSNPAPYEMLLRDFVTANGPDAFTEVVIENLPASRYLINSYHFDRFNGGDNDFFDVLVDDAAGINQMKVNDAFWSASATADLGQSYIVESNGTDDIAIRFVEDSDGDATRFNGMSIIPIADSMVATSLNFQDSRCDYLAVDSPIFYEIQYDGLAELTLDTAGSPIDTEIALFDSSGVLLAVDDDGGPGVTSRLTMSNLPAGTYYLAIADYPTLFGDGFFTEQLSSFNSGDIVINVETGPTYQNDYVANLASLNPLVYWNLGETLGTKAFNVGTLGSAADGVYGSEVTRGLPSINGCSDSAAIGLSKDTQSRVLLESLGLPSDMTAFSASLWVQGEDDDFSSFIAYAESESQANGFLIGADEGEFRTIINGQIVDHPGIDVLDGTPHHVGVSWDGTTMELKIYVDGQLVLTTTQGTNNSILQGGPLAIGQDFDDFNPPYDFDGTQALDGFIDEVALFDRVLTAEEFATLGPPDYPSTVLDSNPEIYWALDAPLVAMAAENLGSSGVLGDGLYGSQAITGETPLLSGSCSSAGFVKNVNSHVLVESYDFPQGDVSVSFWLNAQDFGLSHFFAYAAEGSTNDFVLASNDGEFRIIVKGAIVDFPGVDVLDGQPHHVVVQRDGTTGDVSMYLDGQRRIFENFTTDPLEPTGAIALGQDFDDHLPPYGFDSSQAYDGRMDEFALFDRKLIQGEIVALAEQGVLGDVNGDGLVNLLDVEPFIAALTDGIYSVTADVNGDGLVNLLDVEPFIAVLSG